MSRTLDSWHTWDAFPHFPISHFTFRVTHMHALVLSITALPDILLYPPMPLSTLSLSLSLSLSHSPSIPHLACMYKHVHFLLTALYSVSWVNCGLLPHGATIKFHSYPTCMNSAHFSCLSGSTLVCIFAHVVSIRNSRYKLVKNGCSQRV